MSSQPPSETSSASYHSFPPFQDPPSIPSTSSSSFRRLAAAVLGVSPYDPYDKCVNFLDCGGWVAVKRTACRMCVAGKTEGVLAELGKAQDGAR